MLSSSFPPSSSKHTFFRQFLISTWHCRRLTSPMKHVFVCVFGAIPRHAVVCEGKEHTHTSIKRPDTDWQTVVSYLETTCQCEWHLWRRWHEEVFILSKRGDCLVCWFAGQKCSADDVFHSTTVVNKKNALSFLNYLLTSWIRQMRQHNMCFICKDTSLSGLTDSPVWFIFFSFCLHGHLF